MINSKNYLKSITTSFLLIIIFSCISCKKELSKFSMLSEDQNAITEIKKIVGDKAGIQILEMDSGKIKSMNLVFDTINKFKILSLEQFKEVYTMLDPKHIDSIAKIEIMNPENGFVIKSTSLKSFNEDIDDPIKAGLYKVSFPTGLFNYNVVFRTDGYGRVVEEPKMFFSGIALFSWDQQYITPLSQASFNSNTLSTSYNIIGTAVFGLSYSKLNLGITLTRSYIITINTDSEATQMVTIRTEQF